MAAKPIDESIIKNIIADWRTGNFVYSDLAEKHGVSKAKVGQICKGIDKDLKFIVDAGVQYKQGLVGHDRRIVDAITDVVDERTKHIQFFNSAAIQNVTEAMEMRCDDQNDHKSRADTILKGKEAVLGKEVGNVINNTNAQQINHAQLLKDIAACLPD